MPFPDYRGYTADEIVGTKYVSDSPWHIHMALCWCDYAERLSIGHALHYAGFHLRMGIEQLWFEVLISAQGCSMSSDEYVESLKSTTKLYKFIDARSPRYYRFAEFIKIVADLDRIQHPSSVIWDMSRLKRIHGECGGSLLHFQGVPQKGYLTSEWIEERMRFTLESARWIFDIMKQRGNLVVYFPEGLAKPEVFGIWEQFRDKAISAEDAAIRLKILQPVLRLRNEG